MSFLLALVGSFVAGLVLLALFAAVFTPLLQALGRRFMGILVRESYTGNVISLVNTMQRLGPQTMGELMLRSGSDGKVIQRPLGTPRHLSPWQDLLFNPAQLGRPPLTAEAKVDLGVVIGPKAKRPLRIDIPLLIAGMSYGGALTADVKVALAHAANQVGTATNTGEAFLAEERRAAHKLIVQYHRGTWPMSPQNHPQLLASADAIEIQIGQGAQAGAPMRTPAQIVRPEQRKAYGLAPGKDAVIDGRLQGVQDASDLAELVKRLREAYEVPVGLKFAPSDRIEQDLDDLAAAPVDFICLDGAEGGTHGGPTILQDDFGLPTMHAIARADAHLRRSGRRAELSLIASGGLHTPGMCLKALALGADACYLGTSVLVAAVSEQAINIAPWEPPYSMLLQSGSRRGRFSVDNATQRLTAFLRSSTAEIEIGMRALGKGALAELGRQDMIALTPLTSALTGCRLPLGPVGQESDVGYRPIDRKDGEHPRALH